MSNEQQELFQKFLEDTKERFDKYFKELGYVCFIFNKTNHKGESVYISNSPDNVLPIVEPYANAKTVAESKVKKSKLRKLRRVK